MAYQSEKQLKELGEKLPADKKAGIESAIADVRKALEGTDTDAIKSARDTLETRFQEVSAELYAQAAAAQQQQGAQASSGQPGGEQASSGGGAAKPEGDVVDAEFEMVDEDKKGK